MTARHYTVTCPHTIEVKRTRGDFVTEGKKSYFRVDEIITETRPCLGKSYVMVNENPFGQNSGIDPQGIEVKCKNCGKTYYLFPAIKVKSEISNGG